ncbi:hypothetical protein E4U53_001422 [Claviceps sorghi]|nr:hypothetical protein E4U53_001422 [Claviceps sorghi]
MPTHAHPCSPIAFTLPTTRQIQCFLALLLISTRAKALSQVDASELPSRFANAQHRIGETVAPVPFPDTEKTRRGNKDEVLTSSSTKAYVQRKNQPCDACGSRRFAPQAPRQSWTSTQPDPSQIATPDEAAFEEGDMNRHSL